VTADDAWQKLADGLRVAGHRLAETPGLSAAERADGYRSLTRALNNLLGRLESDPGRPELVEFNGWRQKFFMDNPDYRYWITDIRDDRTYRIVGNIGGSVYQSITVYSGTGVADAAAVARIDSDELTVDADGGFTLTLTPQSAGVTTGLAVPSGASSLWVRHVHDDIDHDPAGWCRIEAVGAPADPPPFDEAAFARGLSQLGKFVGRLPQAFQYATAADTQSPNAIRRWDAMAGGAAFTEPGIQYLRGAWQLDADQALVIEGDVVACRHFNIVLYSRFLNSLDHRHRVVSRTAATTTLTGGAYRYVLAARDPGVASCDWLDTEGRDFGLFVMRFLQPTHEPSLPTVRVVTRDELRAL
jgi:hypothetical protein